MAFSAPGDDILKVGDNTTTYTAGEDVTAGQVVKVNGDSTVVPSDTDGEVAHGVAVQTVASGAGEVAVAQTGTEVLLTAGSGTVSAGNKLRSFGNTSDEGTVEVASTTGDFIVGYAREGAGSPGNTFVGLIDLGGEVN